MAGQADRVAPAGMVLVTGDELAEAVASVRGTVVAVLGPSGNGDVVEDVLQSTWESAWHSRERFDPDRGSLRTWVGTIARNRAVDHLRAVGRSRGGPGGAGGFRGGAGEDCGVDGHGGPG